MNSYLNWDLDAEDLGLPHGSTADEMEHAFATSPPAWVTRVREWCALTGGTILDDYVYAPQGMEVLNTGYYGEGFWSDSAPARGGIKCRGYPEGASAETCVRIWCMRYGATLTEGWWVTVTLPEGVIRSEGGVIQYHTWEMVWGQVQSGTYYKRTEMP